MQQTKEVTQQITTTTGRNRNDTRREGNHRQRGAVDISKATQGRSSATVTGENTKIQPNGQLWIVSAGNVARWGPWKKQCFSKAVREVNQRKEGEESFRLGAASKPKQSSTERWTEQIHIGYTPVRFRKDTGADGTLP